MAVRVLVIGEPFENQSFIDSLSKAHSGVVVVRVDSLKRATERIREIHPHIIVLDGVEDASGLLDGIDPSLPAVDTNGSVALAPTLSHREKETLISIARGLSTKEIAGHLSISPRTVEVYRNALKRKLRLKGAADFARYAIANGLLQISDHLTYFS